MKCSIMRVVGHNDGGKVRLEITVPKSLTFDNYNPRPSRCLFEKGLGEKRRASREKALSAIPVLHW